MRATMGLFVLALGYILGMVSIAQGRAHLWTFDESRGNRAADAIGDRLGDVRGAQWTSGRKGTGLKFDGVDDYVALPDNNPVWLPVDDFTVSFWVRFERDRGSSIPESEVLVDLNYGASEDPLNELGCNIQRRGDTGKIAFQMTTTQSTDEDLYSQLIPNKDTWYHVVAVRQGSIQRLYIDGRMDAWRACSSSPVQFIGGYDDDCVNVGRFTTNTGSPRYHFKGVLDELMLFDRALSAAQVQQLYREALTPNALYVDGTCGLDEHNGLRSLTAVATIQRAIEMAKDGDVVNVLPGVYREEVRFLGKAITLQSAADAAIIEAPEGFGVSFYMGEKADTVLRNLVIANSYVGIFCLYSAPTITNVTITGNVFGAEAYGLPVDHLSGFQAVARPRITNSIIWGNAASDLEGLEDAYCCVGQRIASLPQLPLTRMLGAGSFNSGPLFVDPENNDYHVRSRRGRYWPEHDIWVLDDVSSPCIDAGDPVAGFSGEPKPNGNRLNIGAHGGTVYAELSDPPFTGDINGDDVFDGKDYDQFMALWQQQTNPTLPTPRRR